MTKEEMQSQLRELSKLDLDECASGMVVERAMTTIKRLRTKVGELRDENEGLRASVLSVRNKEMRADLDMFGETLTAAIAEATKLRAKVAELEDALALSSDTKNRALAESAESRTRIAELERVKKENDVFYIELAKTKALLDGASQDAAKLTAGRDVHAAKLEKVRWRKDRPEPEDAILAAVDTNNGADYFVCRVDPTTDMLVDLLHGDDFGWDSEAVSRWVPFDEILTILEDKS